MSKKLAIALLLVTTSAQVDFDALVRAVESTRGIHRVWTPGIGLVRLGVRIVHPRGVHDLQLAVFEGDGNVDLQRLIRTTPGTPMVRTHNNRTGETALVWARPIGTDLMEMLVVAHDPNEDTVVVRVVIDGEMLARVTADPRHAHQIARR